ncbi:MAG: ComF family protein [Alistipes sp.]|nr:ComF family protein [Alistipes sp.]
MSIVGKILRRLVDDLGSLIYDDGCIICGRSMGGELGSICLKCRFEMPTTRYLYSSNNPVKEHFEMIAPIVEASSYLYFRTDDRWRKMIHRLKYQGEWRLGLTFGELYGAELKSSGLYNDVDLVVPVPLHVMKYLKRKYNQSEYIAEGIAKELGVKVDRRSLYRRRNNPSQTRQHASERWLNVSDLFAVRNPERLENRHILLVDDVLTTGATLSACIYALQRDVPTCRISIATLAVAGKFKE